MIRNDEIQLLIEYHGAYLYNMHHTLKDFLKNIEFEIPAKKYQILEQDLKHLEELSKKYQKLLQETNPVGYFDEFYKNIQEEAKQNQDKVISIYK